MKPEVDKNGTVKADGRLIIAYSEYGSINRLPNRVSKSPKPYVPWGIMAHKAAINTRLTRGEISL